MPAQPMLREVTDLVFEIGTWMDPDDVEREVAFRYPWLDEDRLAAAWLLAAHVRDGRAGPSGELTADPGLVGYSAL